MTSTVLDGFRLRVEPGETVAVVGSSGSGKSTLALLLPRYYDVTGGAVRVGGHDVRDLTLGSLRSAIGLVPENSFLFSETIRENIAYGSPDATDEQIRAAARVAQADGFIGELPDGYDTTVGEQGMTLSGGQRQRIALARAMLTDPRLLLLDDATSAVDAHVEHEIHEALRSVMAGRTTLLIAHRQSTLGLADRIAVLDGGRLADVGTHEELTARCALYRRLLTDPDELGEMEQDPAGLAAGAASAQAGPQHGRRGDRVDAVIVAKEVASAAETGVTSELWVRKTAGPRRRASRRPATARTSVRHSPDVPEASPPRWPRCRAAPNSSPRWPRCRPPTTYPASTRSRRSAPRTPTDCGGCCAVSAWLCGRGLLFAAFDAGFGAGAARTDPERHRRRRAEVGARRRLDGVRAGAGRGDRPVGRAVHRDAVTGRTGERFCTRCG